MVKLIINESAQGQLTNPGKRALKALGENIGAKYASILPENLDPKLVTFRSTNIVRTIESLKYLVDGMYPESRRSFSPVHVTVLPRILETAVPSMTCPAIDQLKAITKGEILSKLQPEIDALMLQLRPVSPLSVNDMYDVFASVVGNGMELPHHITDELYEKLEKLAMKIWYYFK